MCTAFSQFAPYVFELALLKSFEFFHFLFILKSVRLVSQLVSSKKVMKFMKLIQKSIIYNYN